MVNCCVPLCSSAKGRKSGVGVSFHELPSDTQLREEWLKRISRDDFTPSDFSVVCSKHFKQDDYKPGLKKRLLKKGASPSVFLEYPTYLQPKDKGERRKLVRDQKNPVKKNM